jgi:predicted amidohydrolase YtcJ
MPAEDYRLPPSSMPVSGIRPSGGVQREASLVIRNARIFTGDPAFPTADAVAVRDGIFVAVGDDRTIAPHVGVGTRVVDALGRRVIPGLNDSHLHVIRGGLNYLLELRWDGVPTVGLALEMLQVQAERTPPGQWVRVVGGWTREQFAENRLPRLSELNAAAPDTPVFVLHLYQCALLNRAALHAVGYDRSTPNPPGGEIVRDHAGEPTGMLLAAPSAALLYHTLAKGPSLNPAEQLTSTRHFLSELNRFGITSAIDAAGGFQSFPDNYGAVMSLAEQGELSVRIAYHLFPQTAGQEVDDLRRWVSAVRLEDGDQWLRVNGAGENLAWSCADFENFAEPRPELVPTAAADLDAAARLLLEHGWGFRLHATYDETIGADLAVFERIAGDGAWPESTRWFFDHAETVSQSNLERIAALGGALSVQNRMMFQGQAFVERYGAARAETAPPVRAMLGAGLLVAAGTDATRVSSYNPWLSLAWLVTGRTMGGLRLYPEGNLVDRATALGMYTAASARLSGEGDVKGTISPGKYADLAILSADYFSVPDAAIASIEALLTVTGGRIVYSAGEYEGISAPLPAITPGWSPVTRFGGFQTPPSGVRQARSVAEAAADSDEHAAWRIRRDGDTAASAARGHAGLLGGCLP